MATLNAQSVNRAGLTPVYSAAAAGGDRFTPDHETFLHVKNGGGAPVTVTVAATEVVGGDMTLPATVVSVPAAGEKMIGPFPAQFFTQTDGTGQATVAYSAVTSVTVAVVKLSQ